jgi:hypothetical protein
MIVKIPNQISRRPTCPKDQAAQNLYLRPRILSIAKGMTVSPKIKMLLSMLALLM